MNSEAKKALMEYRRQYINLPKEIRLSKTGEKFRKGYGLIMIAIKGTEFLKSLQYGGKPIPKS